MFNELRALLSYCRPDATRENYLSAIQEDNCLGKRTVSTRRLSGQRLSELYGLDPAILIFKIMRYFWYLDREGQALLSLLLALARDPLLRITAPVVLRIRTGEELNRQPVTDILTQKTGTRFNENTLDKIVRNAASSWTQSGHLKGHSHKIRQNVTPTIATTTFALLLGYLSGTRGKALFETLWSKVLDTPANLLIQFTRDAKRLGFLDMSQSGDVMELSFSRLLASMKR